MEILIAAVSISAITALVWLINRFLPFRVCPICAGVSLTWLLMSVGVLANQLPITNYQLLIAMLMAGTVVGIAYQGEKRFVWAEKNIFFFKVPVIILGFVLVYLAVNNFSWLGLAVEILILLSLINIFFIQPSSKKAALPEKSSPVSELEEKMKNCC